MITNIPLSLRFAGALGPGLIGLPPDASHEGHRLDSLIHTTLLFLAILFTIMVVWMVVACVRHGRHHVAEAFRGTGKGRLIPLGFAAVVFFVVDGNLLVSSTLDMGEIFWNFKKAEADPAVLRVEVNAHQWAWDFRLAGPDGRFNTADDIVSLNELRVPVDAAVTMQLAAVDVVHSMYLPHFRAKMDAVPGSVTRIWFRPREPGEYEIACAQHCGVNHYKMKARLIVLPRQEFDAWAARASDLSRAAYRPDNPDAHWGWDWKTP